MSQTPSPKLDVDFSSLKGDGGERHEALVDLVGKFILSLRNRSVDSSQKVITTPGAKDTLGSIRWGRYEGVASLSPEQQQAALQFSEATVDRFIQLLLTLLSGIGTDERIDATHAIRFKLIAEVINVDSERIVAEETINRGGEKFFADYWGRWLNRHKSVR